MTAQYERLLEEMRALEEWDDIADREALHAEADRLLVAAFRECGAGQRILEAYERLQPLFWYS